MNQIGILEAKTKFRGLCDQVVRSGSSVIVSPVNQVEATGRRGILDECETWDEKHPDTGSSDFPEVWKMRRNQNFHPFEDSHVCFLLNTSDFFRIEGLACENWGH